MTVDNLLLQEILSLVTDLAAKRYAEIEADGRAGRMNAHELDTVVREYRRTLVPLPEAATKLIDVFANESDPNDFRVDVPLWTQEEGRSDLTLQLTATKRDGGFRLEIDDLHVM